MRFIRALLPAAVLALLATGCSPQAATPSAPGTKAPSVNVVAAFYPLAFVAESVGGEHVKVMNLTTPGQEAHDVEITPKQIAEVNKADLALYLKGFQKQVEDAISQAGLKNTIDAEAALDLKSLGLNHDHDHGEEGHEEGHKDEHKDHDHDHAATDPHFWLDPTLMAKLGEKVSQELSKIDPANAEAYKANLEKFKSELEKLDGEFKQGLATCKVKEFIVSHEAFGYLAKRYNLHQIGISGLSPEAEPSPKRVAEVHELAKKHNVTTIFYETLTSPAVAKSIAGDLGLKTAVLDPIEGITDASAGKDYLQIMRANLASLKAANGCN